MGQIRFGQGNTLNKDKAVDYESVTVTDTAGGVGLANIPDQATNALVEVQGDSAATVVRVIYMNEDGSIPTTGLAGEGMPFGNLGAFALLTRDNMANFLAISVEAGLTHKLKVTYYR